MDSCIFCQIINNQAPRTIVYEDEHVIAIKPIDPISIGHTLVIPKVHAESIFDINETDMVYVAKTMKIVAKQLMDTYPDATGMNILNANGEVAGQTVFHLHFHLVPRYPNDGLNLWLKKGL